MGNSGPVVSVICGNWWVLGAVVGSVESVVSGGSMGAVARGGCRGSQELEEAPAPLLCVDRSGQTHC